jgi:hypothetical protein
MMAHLNSLVEAEAKNDAKFAFKLTQINSESSYTSPVKKQHSTEGGSALES